MVGEGLLVERIARDWDRFGPDARVRWFSAGVELPLAEFKDKPWSIPGGGNFSLDRDMKARGFDLFADLVKLVGRFVHLEIVWASAR